MKKYIGDGVYVDYDGFHIVLSVTRDEPSHEHVIYLDPSVVMSLFQFVGDCHGVKISVEEKKEQVMGWEAT